MDLEDTWKPEEVESLFDLDDETLKKLSKPLPPEYCGDPDFWCDFGRDFDVNKIPEFFIWPGVLETRPSETELQAAFSYVDLDEKGYITRRDLKRYLVGTGMPHHDLMIEGMIALALLSKDYPDSKNLEQPLGDNPRVDYDVFREFFLNPPPVFQNFDLPLGEFERQPTKSFNAAYPKLGCIEIFVDKLPGKDFRETCSNLATAFNSTRLPPEITRPEFRELFFEYPQDLVDEVFEYCNFNHSRVDFREFLIVLATTQYRKQNSTELVKFSLALFFNDEDQVRYLEKRNYSYVVEEEVRRKIVRSIESCRFGTKVFEGKTIADLIRHFSY